MAFTNDEKIKIRKYCGYGAFGSVPVPNFAWRYSVQYGALEFILINLATEEQLEVTTFYLPNLLLLERDIPGTRTNVDTQQAAVWYRNPRELKERWELFNSMRVYLCDFIGCDYGPAIVRGNLRVVP